MGLDSQETEEKDTGELGGGVRKGWSQVGEEVVSLPASHHTELKIDFSLSSII